MAKIYFEQTFLILIFIVLCLGSCSRTRSLALESQHPHELQDYVHPIDYSPRSYVAYHTDQSVIIDGEMNEKAWVDMPWTEAFVDIEGDQRPLPTWATRAKMCWNDDFFIIGATMDEPHIWATLTERDAIMYHDDDFEVFIDPDGDGHHYFEFEMNAFNAIWDLYMLYPYGIDNQRNYIMNWDIRGIQTAVHLNGTINDPSDQDSSWSVEIAIPWNTFKDFKSGPHIPKPGEQWRINFSRVDWTMDINDGQYVKRTDTEGKPLPEDNWVWSPTGYINMHKPETWGYVQFERDRTVTFQEEEEEQIKWTMWKIYYAVKACHQLHGENCTLPDTAETKMATDDYVFSPQLNVYQDGFMITAAAKAGGRYTLDHRAQLKYHEKK